MYVMQKFDSFVIRYTKWNFYFYCLFMNFDSSIQRRIFENENIIKKYIGRTKCPIEVKAKMFMQMLWKICHKIQLAPLQKDILDPLDLVIFHLRRIIFLFLI